MSNWYNTATPVSFSAATPVDLTLRMEDKGPAQPFGTMTPTCSGGYLSSTVVNINPGRHVGAYNTQFWKTYTASHELGHALALGHSTSASFAIMYAAMPASGSGVPNTPQSDDICGVNVMYPSSYWPPTCGY